jgi:hypothetical protein
MDNAITSTLPTASLKKALPSAFLVIFLAASIACSEPAEVTLPLLGISGPTDFSSFEVRTSDGETLWRLEAETPSEVPFLAYSKVPDSFRQAFPENEAPRLLKLGEDLVIESRTSNRVFLHRAFARSESTVTILESEMRQIGPEDEESSTSR